MLLAIELSMKSKCQRRKVGAVLVTPGETHIFTATNNPLPYASICKEKGCLRITQGIESGTHTDICRCIHVEKQVIQSCRERSVSTENAVLYTTLFPCSSCAKQIIGAKIREVIYLYEYSDPAARLLLEQNGIIISKYDSLTERG